MFRVWEPAMPRIDDRILQCTVYLYPSAHDANNGEKAGGTGFLVDVSSEWCPHTYAVTAKHVITEQRSPVVRVNTENNCHEVLPIRPESWIPHPDGDDIAVCPIELDVQKHRFTSIPLHMFITPEIVTAYYIGPGDDVFMVGRLINHEGRQRNLPTARFGNIAMMPYEPLRHPTGIMQESFVVEVRSWSGFSGSPVFVWITGSDGRLKSFVMTPTLGPWLLGVDWGHILDWEQVYENNQRTGAAVRANTGMTGVVPAWKLVEILNSEELVRQRKEKDEKAKVQHGQDAVALDSASPDAEASFTKQDFETALRKASRRDKSSGKGKT